MIISRKFIFNMNRIQRKLTDLIMQKVDFVLFDLKIIKVISFLKDIIFGVTNTIIEGVIYSLGLCAILFLFIWFCGSIEEFISWEKTGHWVTLTNYDFFHPAIDKPFDIISLPGHLGTQNILNKLLFSSYPQTFFISSVILGYIVFILDPRKTKIFLISILFLWLAW